MTFAPVRLAWARVSALPPTTAAAASQWLSAAEAARLERFATARRRAQFLAGRWLVRELLASALGGQPAQWVLSAPDQGPPTLTACAVSGAGALQLAVSHSADLVACAVAPGPVGLDIEVRHRARDIDALAALCCDAQEIALLRAAPQAQREALFYAFWTAKEAWIKRQAEAMTPQRLVQIHLRQAPCAAEAQVRVWRGPGWTLALAAAGPVQWHAPQAEAAGAWQLRDDAAPAAFRRA